MNDDVKNNLSTVAVWVYVVIAPYISDYITQDQFVTLLVAVIGLCVAVYSSANPNTFKRFGNDKSYCECEEDLINEEYEVNPVVDGDS